VSVFRTEVEGLIGSAAKQPMPDVFDVYNVMRNPGDSTQSDNPLRLHFPWKEVDSMANLPPGSVLALYATQTGMGKTALANQIALHGIRKFGEIVVSYQCELSPEEIAVMCTANLLNKDRNFLTKADHEEASHLLGENKYFVGNNPNLEDPEEILNLLEAAVKRFSASILVIDHFHHLTRSETNETAIQGAVARRIKQMAQKYKIKIINVGQPKKANQSSKGKRTHITDAKGSAAYTDDADAVFAIHRELSKGDDSSPLKDTYEAKTLIHAQKTRSKGLGNAEAFITFFGEYAKFVEIDYAHEEPS
jgi:replicative DNA helicase